MKVIQWEMVGILSTLELHLHVIVGTDWMAPWKGIVNHQEIGTNKLQSALMVIKEYDFFYKIVTGL